MNIMNWKNWIAVAVCFITVTLILQTPVFAQGSDAERQFENRVTIYLFVGAVTLSVVLLGSLVLVRNRVKALQNVKLQSERDLRGKLNRTTAGLKWASMASILFVMISGFVMLKQGDPSAPGQPRLLKQTSLNHGHGMSYSSDGQKLFFAVHDGLRIYENGVWKQPAGENHDYMGFSMVDEGFYSSGHPAPNSRKKNPFGIVKSTDDGKSFKALSLYGEVDFHGMSVGYYSHTIYVINQAPNSLMDAPGLFVSTDQTASWKIGKLAGIEDQPQALAVHPREEGTVALGTAIGVYLSKDFGNTFKKISPQMNVTALLFTNIGDLLVGGITDQVNLTKIHLETTKTTQIELPILSEQDAIAFIGQSPVNEKEMSIMTINRDVFTTLEGGDNWEQIVRAGGASSTN